MKCKTNNVYTMSTHLLYLRNLVPMTQWGQGQKGVIVPRLACHIILKRGSHEVKPLHKRYEKMSYEKYQKYSTANSMSHRITAQHSTAQHSTAPAQHSTAQHSTAQHSTARHSTAQHSTIKKAQHSFSEKAQMRMNIVMIDSITII